MNNPKIPLIVLTVLATVLLLVTVGPPKLSGDDMASLLYSGILVAMVGSWAFAEMRGNLGESVRNLLIWGLIVLIIMLAYQYRAQFGFTS